TCGFSLAILSQPPLFNSAWQLEHHGAQRCTTLRSGDLIASRIFCSAGDSARSDVAARSVAKINKRNSDILILKDRGETPNAQRPTPNVQRGSFRAERGTPHSKLGSQESFCVMRQRMG